MPIHIDCLIQWIKNKTNTSQKEHIFIYDYGELECDICKTKYPNEIDYKGQKIPLFTFNEQLDQLKNFVVFEIYYVDQDKVKGLVAINMDNYLERECSIGRRDNNDIVLRDISVSRIHCKISIVNGKVFIRDNKSKFGTLIQLGEKINIEELKNSYVIIGNLKLEFHLFRSNFCCSRTNFNNCIYNPVIPNPIYLKQKSKKQKQQKTKQKENKVIPQKSFINQNSLKNKKISQSKYVEIYYEKIKNDILGQQMESKEEQQQQLIIRQLEDLDDGPEVFRESDMNLELRLE